MENLYDMCSKETETRHGVEDQADTPKRNQGTQAIESGRNTSLKAELTPWKEI